MLQLAQDARDYWDFRLDFEFLKADGHRLANGIRFIRLEAIAELVCLLANVSEFIEIPRGDCWLMGILGRFSFILDIDEAEADSGRISCGYR